MDKLCFYTAAGYNSTPQLVHFHNRVGPLRWTRCQKSNFLTLLWFISGQHFFSVSSCRIEHGAYPFENSVRLLNSALFTPDSSMRKISSSKPALLRSCTALCPFTESNTVTPFTALSYIRNTAFKMKEPDSAACLNNFFHVEIVTWLLTDRPWRLWLSDFIAFEPYHNADWTQLWTLFSLLTVQFLTSDYHPNTIFIIMCTNTTTMKSVSP